jgi:hypothetical protein
MTCHLLTLDHSKQLLHIGAIHFQAYAPGRPAFCPTHSDCSQSGFVRGWRTLTEGGLQSAKFPYFSRGFGAGILFDSQALSVQAPAALDSQIDWSRLFNKLTFCGPHTYFVGSRCNRAPGHSYFNPSAR